MNATDFHFTLCIFSDDSLNQLPAWLIKAFDNQGSTLISILFLSQFPFHEMFSSTS